MAHIHYARVDELWRKEDKYQYLEERQQAGNVEWQTLTPDAKQTWLTEGMDAEFVSFMPLGSHETKASENSNTQTLFKVYSLGISSNRDELVYGFDEAQIVNNVQKFYEVYNSEVNRYARKGRPNQLDDFLSYERIKWSESLKSKLKSGRIGNFDSNKLRTGNYRPFVRKNLYFDSHAIDRPALFSLIFPSIGIEKENLAICVSDHGFRSPFSSLLVNSIPDLHLCASADGFQCFPFYTYNEDGTNRRENITDWALAQFRVQYRDEAITKWDIFHYVYAVLHHPVYRERYAANLKRELPRLLFAPDFHAFADAGKQLAALHVHYETQPEYPLDKIENPNTKLDWRVTKMKLSKDKQRLVYNDFLTLEGIPAATYQYRLGNRSALEWVIDQYQISTDKRSGITNDPNRADDPEYIVRLIGQVITVSLETQKLVQALPPLRADE